MLMLIMYVECGTRVLSVGTYILSHTCLREMQQNLLEARCLLMERSSSLRTLVSRWLLAADEGCPW